MTKRALAQRFVWLMAGALLAFVGSAQADKNWKQNGNSKAATEATQCVKPTEWMRRNHMDLIQHDRDITVHQGVRTLDGSLAQCVACHANKDDKGAYVAVNGADQFCSGCHEYTGVTLDCFTCHATVPQPSNAQAAAQTMHDLEAVHAAVIKAQSVQSAGN